MTQYQANGTTCVKATQAAGGSLRPLLKGEALKNRIRDILKTGLGAIFKKVYETGSFVLKKESFSN